MRSLIVSVFVLVALNVTAPAAAADWLASRSAGKLVTDGSRDLSAELERLDPEVREKPAAAENETADPASQRFAGLASRHDQLFEIYSADAQMLADLDGDGFHHALRVIFDVDVSYEEADVYAVLYLSREGEPWSRYFTTDVFHIHGDSADDAYEVETELLEGYAQGYYDVLIEVYSLEHAYMVTSEVLDYNYLGKDLRLEDLGRDERHRDYYDDGHHHGAGSAGWLVALFLIIQVVIAARGALALSPPAKSEEKKKKTLPWLRSFH